MTQRPRLSVIGTGYLGATHAVCMVELGYEVIGLDVDQAKIDVAAGRQDPVLRARPARAAGQAHRLRPAAVHHRLRRGGRVRRRALRLRGHPAEAGPVRRRPDLRRGGVPLAGPAPEPAARWWSASPPSRPAPRCGWPRCCAELRPAPGGRAGLEPGVPARGLRRRGHPAPGPAGLRGAQRVGRADAARRPSRRSSRPARRSSSPTSPPPSWSRSRPTRSWPPRSASSTRWPRCARRPAPTSPSWPTRSATTPGSAGDSSTPASASAAAACPRTSGPSSPGPASSGVDQAVSFLRDVDEINLRRRARTVELGLDLLDG